MDQQKLRRPLRAYEKHITRIPRYRQDTVKAVHQYHNDILILLRVLRGCRNEDRIQFIIILLLQLYCNSQIRTLQPQSCF